MDRSQLPDPQFSDEDPLLLRDAIVLAGRLGLVSVDRRDHVLAELDQGNLTPTPGAVALAAGIEAERLAVLLVLNPSDADGRRAESVARTPTRDVLESDQHGLERILLARGLLTRTQLRELRLERDASSKLVRLEQQVIRRGLISLPQLTSVLTAQGSMPDKIGRYELVREIARGGMGVVYEALDPTLGRSVAIKTLLDPDGTRADLVVRLRREARLAGGVAHPGIINVHEVGEHQDEFSGEAITYVVMDYVPGPTLGQACAGLSFDARIGILRQVCGAMAEAHRMGVIHRDLKPSNILLLGEHAIITDFGLARTEELSTKVTHSGAVLGTPTYMAPEQVLGQQESIGATADVWALGVMLYEMATGALPFRGSSATAVFAAILAEPLLLPRKLAPGLSLDFEAICLKALSHRSQRRYSDAGALSADLERWSQGYPVHARRATRVYRLQKWAARHRAAVAAAAGILLAVIVAFLGIGHQLRQSRRNERKAQAARRATARERDTVMQQQRLLRSSLADLDSMADVYRVAQLRREYQRLGPQRWKVPAMRAWLTEARALRKRLEAHQRILQRLEQKKRLQATERWQLELVVGLIPRIEPLLKGIPIVEGWLQDKPWRRWRQDLSERWRHAIAAIRAHAKYGGLVITPQEGLLPLGPDPQSTLWEFAHLPSGRAPMRDANLKWIITEQTGIVLVLIPGGAFRMGAKLAAGPAGLNEDLNASPMESPVHRVRLGPYFLAKYELTQAQWLRMTRNNPSQSKPGMKPRGARAPITMTHPVEGVSWSDGNRWLQRWGLMLPTEAQWEYAARAGTRTTWWTGNLKSALPAAGNLADQSFFRNVGIKPNEAWDDGYVVHAPVGHFAPNGFGLYDVIGNVSEWCRDPYLRNGYSLGLRGTDGWRQYSRAALGERGPRIWRGAGWGNIAWAARSARRLWGAPDLRKPTLGLRPARRITP